MFLPWPHFLSHLLNLFETWVSENKVNQSSETYSMFNFVLMIKIFIYSGLNLAIGVHRTVIGFSLCTFAFNMNNEMLFICKNRPQKI